MERRPDIVKEVTIAAPPEAVWKAITEASELVRWFSLDARSTPGVGGQIWISFGGPMEGAVHIVRWEPERHLGTLEAAVGDRKPLTQDWILEARDGGTTMLRFVHAGFESGDWDDEYDSLLHGWDVFMGNLQCYLERHAGRPCVQRMDTFHPTTSRPEAFAKVGAALELYTGKAHIDGQPTSVARTLPPTLIAVDLGDWGRLNLSFEGSEKQVLFATVLGWGVDADRVERASAWVKSRIEGVV